MSPKMKLHNPKYQPPPYGFDECVKFLKFIDPDMPAHRFEKCTTFYNLAKQVPKDGVVVELGTFHGIGVSALTFGANDGNQVAVFTIDSYTRKRGWAGEIYDSEDKHVFDKNMHYLGTAYQLQPLLLVGTFVDIAHTWDKRIPIKLLVWDGGVTPLQEDFMCWERFLATGAKVALHDTQSGTLGSDKLCKILLDSGKYDDLHIMPGEVRVITKLEEMEEDYVWP